MCDIFFQSANQVIVSVIKALGRDGLDVTMDKAAMEPADAHKLYDSGALSRHF